jgi:hypothetical protein
MHSPGYVRPDIGPGNWHLPANEPATRSFRPVATPLAAPPARIAASRCPLPPEPAPPPPGTSATPPSVCRTPTRTARSKIRATPALKTCLGEQTCTRCRRADETRCHESGRARDSRRARPARRRGSSRNSLRSYKRRRTWTAFCSGNSAIRHSRDFFRRSMFRVLPVQEQPSM